MKNKKKIFLRILKEIGRLTLVIMIPVLLGVISGFICMHNLTCHTELYSCLLPCIKFSRIVFFTSPIIIGSILFVFIRRKKLSKLWLIEGISFYLLLFIAGQVIDYVTRPELKPSPLQTQDTLWLEQELEEKNEGVK